MTVDRKAKVSTSMCRLMSFFFILGSLFINPSIAFSQGNNIETTVTHHYVDNIGVKIHYVTKGEGPLILFVHGFPDYWYTWRKQMEALSTDYKVAALDLRGYNRSDSPDGVENYTYEFLIQDIISVIEAIDSKTVYLVAHDWGAGISWKLAAQHPELIDKLVILSIAHPKAGDVKPIVPIEERKASYADYFVSQAFSDQLTESWFSGWVESSAKEHYREAFRRSDKVAMINYYKANFSTLENLKRPDFLQEYANLPNIKMPVLIVHGKKDTYALTESHNNTWKYIDNELIITILPNAGHFIQQDESEKLAELIRQFVSTS